MESACRKYALSIFDEGFANFIGSNYFLKMDGGAPTETRGEHTHFVCLFSDRMALGGLR
jgi:hypothetical protein